MTRFLHGAFDQSGCRTHAPCSSVEILPFCCITCCFLLLDLDAEPRSELIACQQSVKYRIKHSAGLFGFISSPGFHRSHFASSNLSHADDETVIRQRERSGCSAESGAERGIKNLRNLFLHHRTAETVFLSSFSTKLVFPDIKKIHYREMKTLF